MTMDPTAAPVSGAHRQGPPAPAPAVRRPVSKVVALVGVAGALATGLLFGLWAKPELGRRADPAPMRAVSGQTMAIEVNAPQPLPVPASDGKLEVLPTDLAIAANRAAQAAQGLPPPPDLPMRQAPAPRLAVADAAPAPAPTFVPAPALTPAQARPAFDCSGARTPAEQLVCEDPQLAAADRRMTRAFRQALAAGAPPALLREDQRDWLDVREQAARYSPDAVAAVYQQRIGELEELARDTPY